MFTDSNSTQNLVPLVDKGIIVKGFPCAVQLARGTPVRLLNTGSVAAIAAATDVPLGWIESSSNRGDAGNVRVATNFSAIVIAQADGVLDEGNLVACTGLDATTGLVNYRAAVATNWVIGIALSASTDNGQVTIGLLRTPSLKA